jgi:hypothetical protein
VASEGWIVQLMVTFVRYHPRQFAGAGVHWNVMLGTARAAGAASSVSRQTAAHAAAA